MAVGLHTATLTSWDHL